jgi:hypothetical protein
MTPNPGPSYRAKDYARREGHGIEEAPDDMAAKTAGVVETDEHKAKVTQWLEERAKVVPEWVKVDVRTVEWNEGHMGDVA